MVRVDGKFTIPQASLGTTIDTIVNALKQFLVPLLVNIPTMVFFTFVFFLSVFLFLLKGPAVSREIRAALPERLNVSIAKISGLMVNTLYAIYIVMVEVAILTFLIALPLFYLLEYPGYLQLAILAGLSPFIPIISPFIVVAFLVIFELASGNTTGALIAIFVLYPLILWLPGSYIKAKLMGRRIAIYPYPADDKYHLSISVMGIVGLIFGPFFIALLISAYRILIDQMNMAKKGTEIPE